LLVSLALIGRVASAQSVSSHAGEDVKITLRNGGTVRGKLVSLSPEEVVVRRGVAVNRQAMTGVARIETAPHMTRNLAIVGLAAGLVAALATDICGTGQAYGAGSEPACISAKPALYAAGGMAAGALIGHGLDERRRLVLYSIPAAKPGVSAQLRPTGTAVALTFTW
jgi:hypothetical protein